MNGVTANVLRFLEVYLDDIIIQSESLEEHAQTQKVPLWTASPQTQLQKLAASGHHVLYKQ
jgi:hypothetical protein